VLLLSPFAVQTCLTFRMAGVQNILHIPFSALRMAAGILFIVGAGSYFGVRLRTTTVAAAATFGSHLCPRRGRAARVDHRLVVSKHPAVHLAVMLLSRWRWLPSS
jgi:hypothetical protein